MPLLDKLYSLYSITDKKSFLFRKKGGIYKSIYLQPYKLLSWIVRTLLFSLEKNAKDLPILNAESNTNTIVSLTSFPLRVGKLHYVIKSLLRQDFPIEKIILWLTKEEFPNEKKDLPNSLLKLQENGLEIRLVEENLRSHLKYFYCFKEYPNKTIVTADDDLYYAKDTVSQLVELSQKHPKAVCSNIVREIAFEDNAFAPYKKWIKKSSSEVQESKNYLALGYAGVLYPAELLNKEPFIDIDTIKSTCLRADDLWLKAHELMQDVTVAYSGNFFAHPIFVPGSQEVSLQETNLLAGTQNDTQWEALNEKYKLGKFFIK